MKSHELQKRTVHHDETEDSKWQFNKYQQDVATIGQNRFTSLASRYAWFSTHHSDYFCTQKDDWIFNTCDGGRIRIVKKQTYREPELQAKLEVLKGLPYSGDDKVVGDYMARMQTLYEHAAERRYELIP